MQSEYFSPLDCFYLRGPRSRALSILATASKSASRTGAEYKFNCADDTQDLEHAGIGLSHSMAQDPRRLITVSMGTWSTQLATLQLLST